MKTVAPGVGQGEDGWLFLQNDPHDVLAQHTGRRLLGAKELRAWQRAATQRAAWLDRFQSRHVLLVLPNAHTVLASRLGSDLPLSPRRPVTQLIEALGPENVVFPADRLSAAESSGRRPYCAGASHLSWSGACTAVMALVEGVGHASGRRPRRLGWDEVELGSVDFVGDLADAVPGRPVHPLATCRVVAPRARREYESGPLHVGAIQVHVQADETLPTCCCFGDVQAAALVPYLAESFSRLVFVQRPGIDPELVERERPDLVVQVVTERFLVESPSDQADARTDELVIVAMRHLDATGRQTVTSHLAAQAAATGWPAPEPHLHLGLARLVQGDRAGAVTAVAEALRRAPDWPAALLARAELHELAEEHDACAEARSRAAALIKALPYRNRYPSVAADSNPTFTAGRPDSGPSAEVAQAVAVAAPDPSSAPVPGAQVAVTASVPAASKAPVAGLSRPRGTPWWRHPALLCTVLPTLACGLYWGVVATPRFAATAQFQVASQGLPGASGALAFLGLPSTGGSDNRLVYSFLKSSDLVRALDQDMGLRSHYQQPSVDLISRLAGNATTSDFVKKYRSLITTAFEDSSSLITFEVQAYDPDYVKQLAERILARADAYLNEAGHMMARERLSFYQVELRQATEEAEAVRRKLTEFQERNGILDPIAEATARSKGMIDMEAELIKQRTGLADLLVTQGEQSEMVRRARARIADLERQLAAQRALVVSKAGSGTEMNRLGAEWQRLSLELDFRLQVLKAAAGAYEQAQAEVGQKLKALVVVARPYRPEEAIYPHLWRNLVVVLAACLLLYISVSLIVDTIREHRD